jgi:hypothetical protein
MTPTVQNMDALFKSDAKNATVLGIVANVLRIWLVVD